MVLDSPLQFLRMTAGNAVAHLSQRSSVCLSSVCLSVTRVDQSKVKQARIAKCSLSSAWKTLVSGTIRLFHKFEKGHHTRVLSGREIGKIIDFQPILEFMR